MSQDENPFDAYRAQLPRKVVKLSRPLPAHGRMVSELTIVEPTLEDLERTELEGLKNPAQLLRVVLASCAGIPPSSAQKLAIRDVNKCQEALAELGFSVSDLYALLGVTQPTTSSLPSSGLPPSTAPTA